MTFAPKTAWAPFLPYGEIKRGDIVVFYKPHPEAPDLILVKRVIGLPGDRTHLRNGIVYINGKAQDEPYAAKTSDAGYLPYRDDFPAIPPSDGYGITATWAEDLPSHVNGEDIVVPAGMYFAWETIAQSQQIAVTGVLSRVRTSWGGH